MCDQCHAGVGTLLTYRPTRRNSRGCRFVLTPACGCLGVTTIFDGDYGRRTRLRTPVRGHSHRQHPPRAAPLGPERSGSALSLSFRFFDGPIHFAGGKVIGMPGSFADGRGSHPDGAPRFD